MAFAVAPAEACLLFRDWKCRCCVLVLDGTLKGSAACLLPGCKAVQCGLCSGHHGFACDPFVLGSVADVKASQLLCQDATSSKEAPDWRKVDGPVLQGFNRGTCWLSVHVHVVSGGRSCDPFDEVPS